MSRSHKRPLAQNQRAIPGIIPSGHVDCPLGLRDCRGKSHIRTCDMRGVPSWCNAKEFVIWDCATDSPAYENGEPVEVPTVRQGWRDGQPVSQEAMDCHSEKELKAIVDSL